MEEDVVALYTTVLCDAKCLTLALRLLGTCLALTWRLHVVLPLTVYDLEDMAEC